MIHFTAQLPYLQERCTKAPKTQGSANIFQRQDIHCAKPQYSSTKHTGSTRLENQQCFASVVADQAQGKSEQKATGAVQAILKGQSKPLQLKALQSARQYKAPGIGRSKLV